MQFRQTCWHFSASKLKLPPSMSEKRCKRINIQSKVFQQNDPLDTWDAISQPLLAHFAQKFKTFSLGFEKNVQSLFFAKKSLFLAMVVRNRRTHFWHQEEKRSTESKKVFGRSPKIFKKSVFWKVSTCNEKDHMDTYNAAWTTVPQIFSYRTQCLSGKNGF